MVEQIKVGQELLLTSDSNQPYMKELNFLAKLFRRLMLPHKLFSFCAFLKGTTGHTHSVANAPVGSFAVMWRTGSNTIEVYPASSIRTVIAVEQTNIFLYWQEDVSQEKVPEWPMIIEPTNIPVPLTPSN